MGKRCFILSRGEEGNPAGLSSCSGGLRPLVELCVEPAGLCGRCTGVALGSPIFPSGCEGKLGVALVSPQGRRGLT